MPEWRTLADALHRHYSLSSRLHDDLDTQGIRRALCEVLRQRGSRKSAGLNWLILQVSFWPAGCSFSFPLLMTWVRLRLTAHGCSICGVFFYWVWLSNLITVLHIATRAATADTPLPQLMYMDPEFLARGAPG